MTSHAFPAVFAAMTAAHHVGDYLLQNDHQAQHKMESWTANQAHVASYHLAQLAAIGLTSRALGLRLSPARLAAGVAVSWVTHSVIDRRWPVRWWMTRTGSKGFYEAGGAPHVDQAMHHAALFTSALIVTSGPQDTR
ncbi:DUF3307 domain-containing protein [Nocardiopsis sp. RV163]|uniref:DUF3307 domain-containing protein n=1 Tax=Nocardiopsis sp. RV163 TaxID=1661388 RepID=UPI00064C4643|nr:DUF3307 domain-containing protein [Nocardiopsis sp. RV163]